MSFPCPDDDHIRKVFRPEEKEDQQRRKKGRSKSQQVMNGNLYWALVHISPSSCSGGRAHSRGAPSEHQLRLPKPGLLRDLRPGGLEPPVRICRQECGNR